MKQPIYIDNTTAQNKINISTGNQINVTSHSAINLDRNKTYEIGLTNASIVYCNPNVINRYLRLHICQLIIIYHFQMNCTV